MPVEGWHVGHSVSLWLHLSNVVSPEWWSSPHISWPRWKTPDHMVPGQADMRHTLPFRCEINRIQHFPSLSFLNHFYVHFNEFLKPGRDRTLTFSQKLWGRSKSSLEHCRSLNLKDFPVFLPRAFQNVQYFECSVNILPVLVGTIIISSK